MAWPTTSEIAPGPGVYFLNCGVTGDDSLQFRWIIDALVIRVLPLESIDTFGPVHFHYRAAVTDD